MHIHNLYYHFYKKGTLWSFVVVFTYTVQCIFLTFLKCFETYIVYILFAL